MVFRGSPCLLFRNCSEASRDLLLATVLVHMLLLVNSVSTVANRYGALPKQKDSGLGLVGSRQPEVIHLGVLMNKMDSPGPEGRTTRRAAHDLDDGKIPVDDPNEAIQQILILAPGLYAQYVVATIGKLCNAFQAELIVFFRDFRSLFPFLSAGLLFRFDQLLEHPGSKKSRSPLVYHFELLFPAFVPHPNL